MWRWRFCRLGHEFYTHFMHVYGFQVDKRRPNAFFGPYLGHHIDEQLYVVLS